MEKNSIPSRLYRLVRSTDWATAVSAGSYRGVDHDAADGFVHLSTAEQVAQTAERYYQGLPDVSLLTLDRDRLDGVIKMEPSSKGALFPHLYGSIPLEAVLEVQHLSLTDDGRLDVPYLRGE